MLSKYLFLGLKGKRKGEERIYDDINPSENLCLDTLPELSRSDAANSLQRTSQYVSCYNTLPSTLSRDAVLDSYDHLDIDRGGEVSTLQQIKRKDEIKALSLSRNSNLNSEDVVESNGGRIKCKVIVEMEPNKGTCSDSPVVYEHMQ